VVESSAEEMIITSLSLIIEARNRLTGKLKYDGQLPIGGVMVSPLFFG
jgi:hypothetical protein